MIDLFNCTQGMNGTNGEPGLPGEPGDMGERVRDLCLRFLLGLLSHFLI